MPGSHQLRVRRVWGLQALGGRVGGVIGFRVWGLGSRVFQLWGELRELRV